MRDISIIHGGIKQLAVQLPIRKITITFNKIPMEAGTFDKNSNKFIRGKLNKFDRVSHIEINIKNNLTSLLVIINEIILYIRTGHKIFNEISTQAFPYIPAFTAWESTSVQHKYLVSSGNVMAIWRSLRYTRRQVSGEAD